MCPRVRIPREFAQQLVECLPLEKLIHKTVIQRQPCGIALGVLKQLVVAVGVRHDRRGFEPAVNANTLHVARPKAVNHLQVRPFRGFGHVVSRIGFDVGLVGSHPEDVDVDLQLVDEPCVVVPESPIAVQHDLPEGVHDHGVGKARKVVLVAAVVLALGHKALAAGTERLEGVTDYL